MRLWFVDADGIHERDPDDIVEGFLSEGFWWLDAPTFDDATAAVLRGLGCHPLVIDACARRNYVPVVHTYSDHFFVVQHTPLLGGSGHVHLLELDQIVAERYVVTVHGPINPDLEIDHALVETDAVLRRIQERRLAPSSPAHLAYAVSSAVARRQASLVSQVAEKLPGLEHEVMASKLREPEALLESMFLVRHELITARTMAAQTHDVWARLAGLGAAGGDAHADLESDLADQFDRVRSIADGEAQFLFGVIELYQTKVHTKMTVAMERLAVIAAVTLPVTAIASIYGMNVIVHQQTHYLQLGIILVVMLAISGVLLSWTRRQGWW